MTNDKQRRYSKPDVSFFFLFPPSFSTHTHTHTQYRPLAFAMALWTDEGEIKISARAFGAKQNKPPLFFSLLIFRPISRKITNGAKIYGSLALSRDREPRASLATDKSLKREQVRPGGAMIR